MAKPHPRTKDRLVTAKSPSAAEGSYDALAVAHFQALTEKKLTTEVLVPLMFAIGYERVDQYGGPFEAGKDLICWRTDELGSMELGVAQVKRFKATSAAKSSRSFMELVNQLQQAAEESVPCHDGKEYRPQTIYFITPYPIDTRALQTRFHAYASLRERRLRVIDGPLLAQLVRRHLPGVAQEICGVGGKAHEVVQRHLSNEILLRALDARTTKDIASLYAEPSFAVGALAGEGLLRGSFSPQITALRLKPAEWPLLRQILLALAEEGVELCEPPVSVLDSVVRQLEKRSLFFEERHLSLEAVRAQAKRKVREAPVDDVAVELRLDGRPLAALLLKGRDLLEELSAVLGASDVPTSRLKDLFVAAAQVLKVASLALSSRQLLTAVGLKPSQEELPVRVPIASRMSIHSVLETGINTAILGEVGAGKTTCLQMHAARYLATGGFSRLVLFVPLARAVAQYIGFPDASREWHPVSHLFRLVLTFLEAEGVRVPESELRDALRDRPALLLLDGIDEVVKATPWIVEAAQLFHRSYESTQVVVSARVGGDYLSQFECIPLRLLPFSDRQRDLFISRWFDRGHRDKATQILEHVETSPGLAAVIRNPLSATILCVLAENGVPLPDTEVLLYEERLRLLLGDYDIHKQAHRLASRRHSLEMVARRLAFWLHSQGRTEAELETLIDAATGSLGARLRRHEVALAVRELLSPCNILVPMSGTGGVGFGHLRYQEHLAALELVHNRGIDVTPLLYDSWWRGPLVLFAQLTDDLSFIAESVFDRGFVEAALPTLEEMLQVGYSRRRDQLMAEVRSRADLEDSVRSAADSISE